MKSVVVKPADKPSQGSQESTAKPREDDHGFKVPMHVNIAKKQHRAKVNRQKAEAETAANEAERVKQRGKRRHKDKKVRFYQEEDQEDWNEDDDPDVSHQRASCLGSRVIPA